MKFSVGVVIACIVVCVGCKSKQEGAVESFAKTYSCPEGRITIRARADLDWLDVVTGNLAGNVEPPADVAADPERLALWTEQRRRQRAASSEIQVFELEGCGHHDYVGCTHPDSYRRGNRSRNRAEVSCTHYSIDREEKRAAKAAEKAAEKDAKRRAREVREQAREERAREREERRKR